MPRKSAEDRSGDANSGPTLQGVSRALRVLEVLAEQPMRTSELSELLDVSWATLQRTVSQLEADEFIHRDPNGYFHVGRKSWLIGSTYLVGHRLLELAVPLLARESARAPSSVLQLVERGGGSSVVLYTRESASSEVITRTNYGYHFPLHCGSKGHVLLAHQSDAFIDDYLSRPLLALTPYTMTDPDEIRERLALVRQQGYAITEADVQPFTASVSAPIFDALGDVQSCVCAVVLKSSLSGERREKLLELVQRMATALSLGLGWQPLQHARAMSGRTK